MSNSTTGPFTYRRSVAPGRLFLSGAPGNIFAQSFGFGLWVSPSSVPGSFTGGLGKCPGFLPGIGGGTTSGVRNGRATAPRENTKLT